MIVGNPSMTDEQTERLARWWATLSAGQRTEAKTAAASRQYPEWLVAALNGVSGFSVWGWVDDPSASVTQVMHPDVTDWLTAQSEV
jgi:hypothetical protein